MTPDPFDQVRTELVRAAARRQRRRRLKRPGRRGLAVVLVGATLGGTAAGAVISGRPEPSAPAAGTIPGTPARPGATGYAIDLSTSLRAGTIGWCTTVRLTRRGRPSGASQGCGAAAPRRSPFVAGGTSVVGGRTLTYALVRSRVAAIRLPDGRRIATVAAPRLPDHLRAAVALARGGTRDAPRFAPLVAEDATGRALPEPTPTVRLRAGADRRRVLPGDEPARCTIAAGPGLRRSYAQVAVGPARVEADDRGLPMACFSATFHVRGGKAVFAALLVNPRDARAQAPRPVLAPSASLRPIGPAWLVVLGAAPDRRLASARLRPRL